MSNVKRKIYYVMGALILIFGISIWGGAQPTAASTALQEENEPEEQEQEEQEGQEEQETSEQDAQSVWDVITANEQLSDFRILARAAALNNNLHGDGPFTVFVPSNAALEDLQSKFADTTATPTDVLLYHIVNGHFNGPDVANRSTLTTLLGEQINVNVENGQIVLNGTAVVTTLDIRAENGVVHIIDEVLLPPENALSMSDKGSRDASLWQVLQEDGRFTTFLALAEQAGLADELSNTNNTFTIFAPTDTGFANIGEELVNEYTRNDDTIAAILSYHLVGDQLGINQVATDTYIPTLEGRPLFVTYTEDTQTVEINGQPLTDVNIVAANGVIHVVDSVFAP